jgi:hypothetical protein
MQTEHTWRPTSLLKVGYAQGNVVTSAAITTYNTEGTIQIVVNFVSRGMRGSFASLMPTMVGRASGLFVQQE